MELHHQLFHISQGLFNQGFPIQIPLGIQDLTQGGLGLGMLGGKDGAAVLVGEDGGVKGADVAGDLRALHQLRHFREGGFIDLQSIAPEWGIEEKSLRKLSAIVLGQRVSKAQRLSNWESSTLTDKQQLYAATDAWACLRIYKRLLKTPKNQ